MTAIRVGDRVRTPQGRIPWTVTRIGESNGQAVAWMRSEGGSIQRYRTDRLIRVQSDDLSTAETTSYESDDRWETFPDGATLCNGQTMACPDYYVHTSVEWRWPHYDGKRDKWDDVRPRSVTATVCQADDNGERWLQIGFTEPDEGGGVGLRKDAALELGLALVKMSSYLGGGRTPGR